MSRFEDIRARIEEIEREAGETMGKAWWGDDNDPDLLLRLANDLRLLLAVAEAAQATRRDGNLFGAESDLDQALAALDADA